MRAGVYVYEAATVTVTEAATLTRFTTTGLYPEQRVPAGALHLQPGIYRLTSAQPLQVLSDRNCEVTLSLTEGDSWPDPKVIKPARFSTAFPEVTHAQLQEFFQLTAPALAPAARGSSAAISVHTLPAASAAPDAHIMPEGSVVAPLPTKLAILTAVTVTEAAAPRADASVTMTAVTSVTSLAIDRRSPSGSSGLS